MKCAAYCTPYCQKPEQPCTHVVNCRHGWIQFWNPAERAGLKAMGEIIKRTVKLMKACRVDEQRRMLDDRHDILMWTTRAFVAAARKAKEGS